MRKELRLSCLPVGAGLLWVFLFLVLPAESFSHAFPDHSDPRVGATVQTAPSLVRIWFDSALEPAFCTITVQDSAGRKVDKGNGRVDPEDAALLEVNLTSLPPGKYKVVWNVVARDGHRTTGDYTFEVK